MNHLRLDVVQAISCTSALKTIEQTDFDLIISDMYMPDGSGLTVLQHAFNLQPDAKRVLMSGNMLYSDLTPEQSHIVDEILQKPFSLQSLKNLLQKFSSLRDL